MQLFGDHWNPAYYAQNSQMQYDTSLKIIHDIRCNAPEKILDLGSGDGKITDFLSKKYPMAQVIGLDISDKMTSYAQNRYAGMKQLNFLQMDMQDLNFVNEFDLIVSFWAFAWVQNHETTLLNVIKALTPEGILHLLVPLNSPELEKAIFHTCADLRWNAIFAKMQLPNMITHELYENIILKHNLKNIKLCKTKISYNFNSYEQLKCYLLGWLPLLQYIEEPHKGDFVESLLTYYQDLLLLNNQNSLSVTFDCIIVSNTAAFSER